MGTKLLFTIFFISFLWSTPAQEFSHAPFLKNKLQQIHTSKNANAFQTSSADVIYDSIYQWDIDSAGKRFLATKMVDFVYDKSNDLMSVVLLKLENHAFVPSARISFTHDNKHREISNLQQTWDGITWVNAEQTLTTYISNKIQSTTQQIWNKSAASWENREKVLYTYNTHGNILTEEYQSGSPAAGDLRLHYDYTYNSDNQLENKLGKMYDNAVWTEQYNEFYSYDSKGNLTGLISQGKDANHNWVNRYMQTFTYDNNNKVLTEKKFDWNNTNTIWLEVSKSSGYKWDPNNNLTSYKTELYDANNTIYIPVLQYLANYNSFNELTDETTNEWNPITGTLTTEGDSIHYFVHEQPDGINDFKNSKTIFIYPNPSNGTFTVNMENRRQIQNIEVYNVIGDRILQQHSSNQVTIPDAQTGIYFVKIDDGIATYTKKITVQ